MLNSNTTQVPSDVIFLLPDRTLVESQLLALQNVSVDTSTLARARGNHGVQAAGLELSLDGALDLAVVSEAIGLLLGHAVALLLLLNGLGLGLASATNGLAVVRLVPLAEGSGVNLDDGRLGQGVCADQFVVGRVEHHANHTGLAGDALRAPGEVTGVETEGTELLVATAGADQVDSLAADTGAGGLAALVESSVLVIVRICVLLSCPDCPVSHTSSCGRKNASHRCARACGASRVRYPCWRLMEGSVGRRMKD